MTEIETEDVADIEGDNALLMYESNPWRIEWL